MTILVINGSTRTVEATTLAELARELELPSRGVAIARNEEIAPRSTWDAVALRDGDRIELVTAVQGGAS